MEYKNTIITFDKVNEALTKYIDKNVFFIIDNNLNVDSLLNEFKSYRSFRLDANEFNKSLDKYNEIISLLINYSYSKHDYIIAIGGGITLDLAGYVAATFKRGMNLVLVPTSLLAMCDASIGGKCALNFGLNKNMIGTFYDPEEVIIDDRFLDTLPEIEFKNGFIEMIKMGLISNSNILSSIKDERLLDAIKESVFLKKEIVLKDYYDKNERHALNFGHTIAHAIELMNPSFKHGFAVATGILIFTDDLELRNTLYNEFKGMFDIDEYLSFVLNNRYEVLDNINQDKKVRMNNVECVILNSLNNYSIVSLSLEDIDKRIRGYFNV